MGIIGRVAGESEIERFHVNRSRFSLAKKPAGGLYKYGDATRKVSNLLAASSLVFTAHCLLPTALRRLAFGRPLGIRRLRHVRIHRCRRFLFGLKLVLLIVSALTFARAFVRPRIVSALRLF
jgi:hypothetical protein